MLRIAIIQFPGLNTEYETRREINKTGMRGEFFRWNEDFKKLAAYDGYVIGGGFAYEDRGRAGIIASLEPIMKELKAQSEKGKPVLGICNGAQILVEAGLIPGADGNKLAMALARNKRIKDEEIIGTGYYNTWVHLKCTAPKQSCMFTWNIPEGEILRAPIAHGEGRFTTDIAELFPLLQSKGQIALRYCDRHGVITQDFPINPNGAVFNTAAICNPDGNVMAVMPHLERDFVSSAKLFTSMRDALLARKAGGLQKRSRHLHVKPVNSWPIKLFQPKEKSFKLFISLIITDNEADTFEMTIKNLGWPKISLKRKTLVELEYTGKPDFLTLSRKLIQSGVLLNTNKELATVEMPKRRLGLVEKSQEQFTFQLLIREKPDFVGMAKLATIQKRLKFSEITGVHIGTLWEIHIPTKSKNVAEQELKRLVGTNLFFNPHRQEAYLC
ncbi:phosphoribosylformylglycinamidine synthase I [Candidatus Peregrinibacteria bacterium]|nr:phosphoribosylformylglycinamidine synthase I [Candidatus Peregrinibacteria bacterium]